MTTPRLFARAAPIRLLKTPTPSVDSSRRRFFSADRPPPWFFDEVKRVANTVLVDVREPDEVLASGKIPGAVNIPMTRAAGAFSAGEDEFREAFGFERPGRGRTLVFYCKAGVRAKTAAELARRAGWDSVGEYSGSWLDWEANGGPVERVNS